MCNSFGILHKRLQCIDQEILVDLTNRIDLLIINCQILHISEVCQKTFISCF